MIMPTHAIGYIATATSVVGFTTQIAHTVRSKTLDGLSLWRTALDVLGLTLWICYATRLEDIPLLIATSFEFLASIGVCAVVIRQRCRSRMRIKDLTPPNSSPTSSQEESSGSCVIDVRPRANTFG